MKSNGAHLYLLQESEPKKSLLSIVMRVYLFFETKSCNVKINVTISNILIS